MNDDTSKSSSFSVDRAGNQTSDLLAWFKSDEGKTELKKTAAIPLEEQLEQTPVSMLVAGMTYRQWLIGQAVAGLCGREVSREIAWSAIRMAGLVCELLKEERLKKSQQK